MAYLKGGTYVDGNLYVQDAVIVSRLEDPSGNFFPYYDFSSIIGETNGAISTVLHRLPMFTNDAGGLSMSYLGTSELINDDGSPKGVALRLYDSTVYSTEEREYSNNSIFIKSKKLILDSSNDYKWKFS